MTEGTFNNSFKDKVIRCVDCGRDFTFTAGEQAFFNSKRPPLSEPKRCKICRDFRRQTIHPPIDSSEVIERARALFPNDYHPGVSE